MKKLIAFVLVLAMALSLAGCKADGAWEALLEEGREYLEAGKVKKAVSALEEALEQAPKGEKLWVYLALLEAHEAGEDTDSILQLLEQAKEEGFDNWRLDRYWERLEEQLNIQGPEEGQTGADIPDGPEQPEDTTGQAPEGAGAEAIALYTIERKDYSVYSNESKTTGIELYFDLLQFHPSLEKFREANGILMSMHDHFAADVPEVCSDETMKRAQMYQTTLTNTYTAEVPYQDSRYICVRYEVAWWMGGSFTADYDTFLFAMEDGRLLTLEDLFADTAQGHRKVCDAVKAVTADFGDSWTQSIADKVSAMALKEFEFFLDESGQIVVYFDTYEIAPGAAGRVEVPLGISVK